MKFKRISDFRFSDFARRVSGRLFREYRNVLEQLKFSFISTYIKNSAHPIKLAQRFQFLDSACLARIKVLSPGHPSLIKRLAENSLAHCFDLLGSGPVIVKHGMFCAGLEGCVFAPVSSPSPDSKGEWLKPRINRANLAEAQRIWSKVDEGYHPIDWQLDFKSGYRWREKQWYRKIRFAHLPGVDIKIPWELARMQHLPVLALAAHYAKAEQTDFLPFEIYCREVRNQILDFISTNSPGFGVNWSCPMDVGIRIANMLVARDVLLAAGFVFDEDFETIFSASVRSHGRHLAGNLEWAPRFRANHYLANIVGLLFVAVFLPRDNETDLWLTFGTEELLTEIEYQFHSDGSNFEGSVCYHRLSTEIILWGIALLENLSPQKCNALDESYYWLGHMPPERKVGPVIQYHANNSRHRSPISENFRQRLAGMASFTHAMTKPDGLSVQFGDNDSGRFLTLGGLEQIRADGDPAHSAWSLDHSGLIAGINAYLGAPPVDACSELIVGLAGRVGSTNRSDFPDPRDNNFIGNDDQWYELQKLASESLASSYWRSEFLASPGLCDELDIIGFPGMGCFTFRNSRLYLAVRCGEIGLVGLGAHTHCDQLAIELVIDGHNIVSDPGTYLYTPLPARRNEYRSASAHYVPRSGEREPANLFQGIFDLRGAAEGECLYFGPRGFIGRHAGYGDWVYRIVALEDSLVMVIDFSPAGLPMTDPSPKTLAYSPAYGHYL